MKKNTRTVNTAKGDKKIISVPLFEKEKDSNVKVTYGSAFLPDFIQLGDTVGQRSCTSQGIRRIRKL